MPSSPATTRDRILAAAIEVIKARGVTAATTKEIARSAGVSEGSLYNHFANKTALFAAALGEVTGTARTAITTLIGSAGQASVQENLTRLASGMIGFYAELLPMTGPVLADPDLIAWLRTHTTSPITPPEPSANGTAAPNRPAAPTSPAASPSSNAPAETSNTPPAPGPAVDSAPSPDASSAADSPSASEAPSGQETAPFSGPAVEPPTADASPRGGSGTAGSAKAGEAVPGVGLFGAGALAGPVLGVAGVAGYLEAEQRLGRVAEGAPVAYLAAALLGGCQMHAFLVRLAGVEAVEAGARLPGTPEEYAVGLVNAVMAGHITRE
ncbi:TetR/AcrR family transcriptional regulator [Actinomadura rupiterrae]|uniref:TetR/AcrR family transcriptional regulator n=1 Tax=Actinomadura rupiterrae TaxID=559627 RepID=UPI0020A32871|nr:TetR/AcrR family transcriptional regulator [Actinomadura rupiterrae]MCP2337028.1 AcrR family transcriptional regulator [Actinomadura rupiterrae]